ncbi:hypothetical protein IG631_16956 [Alternaria alternata]|nr:hypothetical protein IG631_16956 [Alternaria alternata]
MREAGGFPFMDLPTELRWDIYNYLPEIAYEPVFPEPFICSWKVCRMPTSLLQVNKTIYEDAKHPSVQKQVQKVNDPFQPKIVLGPTHKQIAPVYIALSRTFYQAGKRLHTNLGGFQELGNEIENMSLELASWYNDTYLPHVSFHWKQGSQQETQDSLDREGDLSEVLTYLPQHISGKHEEAFETPTKCRPESLHRFVGQTLRRMAIWKTCEIRIRLLEDPYGIIPRRGGDSGEFEDLTVDYMMYEGLAAMDTARQALSLGMSRELTIVHFVCYSKSTLAETNNHHRRSGRRIKMEKPGARDWDLLDMALSLCNSDERVLLHEKIQKLKDYISRN